MERVQAKEPVPKEVNPSGLTVEEEAVMAKLLECYGLFLKLDREHPDEVRDFVDGVHRIQGVLAMRAVRRSYPGGWVTFGDTVP